MWLGLQSLLRLPYNKVWGQVNYFSILPLQALSPTDRSNLLDDAFNLARAGILGYDVALEMTSYLEKENDYLPWESAVSGLSYLADMLEFTGDFIYMQVCHIDKFSKVLIYFVLCPVKSSFQ